MVLGATGFAMLQSKSAGDEYNSLNSKNKELASSYAVTGSTSTKAEYESNQSKMRGLMSTMQTMDALTLV